MADQLPAAARRITGLVMVAIVIALLALCYAAYSKVFTSVVPVTMRIAQVDNSFAPQAEVRLHGVVVGEVTDVTSDGSQAEVTLALQPDKVAHIPGNVSAQLLPKTLFGDRYVALKVPDNPTAQRIQAGDVIPQDRSSTTVQIDRIFDRLLPVLLAVSPKDLANTLGAINQGLAGRGEKLGRTISQLHAYLKEFNPALPELTADLRALPPFTDTYSKAAPDLIEGLTDATVTTNTLVDKRDDFAELYDQLTDTANDLDDFLRDNKDDIIDLARVFRPTAELLARYSPEYVCLFTRLRDAVPLGFPAFGFDKERPALQATTEIVLHRGKYVPRRDEPEYTDNRGPACYDNTAPLEQYPGGPYKDGSVPPPATATAALGNLLTGGLLGPVLGANTERRGR